MNIEVNLYRSLRLHFLNFKFQNGIFCGENPKILIFERSNLWLKIDQNWSVRPNMFFLAYYSAKILIFDQLNLWLKIDQNWCVRPNMFFWLITQPILVLFESNFIYVFWASLDDLT